MPDNSPALIELLRGIETGIEPPQSGTAPAAILEGTIDDLLLRSAAFGPPAYIAEVSLSRFAAATRRSLEDSTDDELLTTWRFLVRSAHQYALEIPEPEDPRLRSFVRTTGTIFGVNDEFVPGLLKIFHDLPIEDRWSLLHSMSEAPMYEHWKPKLEDLAPDGQDDGTLRSLRLLIREVEPQRRVRTGPRRREIRDRRR